MYVCVIIHLTFSLNFFRFSSNFFCEGRAETGLNFVQLSRQQPGQLDFQGALLEGKGCGDPEAKPAKRPGLLLLGPFVLGLCKYNGSHSQECCRWAHRWRLRHIYEASAKCSLQRRYQETLPCGMSEVTSAGPLCWLPLKKPDFLLGEVCVNSPGCPALSRLPTVTAGVTGLWHVCVI